MRRGGNVGNQDKEIIRSVDRAINTEESRIKIFGEGYTRQSLTLGKQYVPALLGHIVAAKPLQYEREVWRALKDIARDDLAWRLFCAGVTAVCNEKAGCDKDGYKNIREQALVIGAGLVGCLDDTGSYSTQSACGECGFFVCSPFSIMSMAFWFLPKTWLLFGTRPLCLWPTLVPRSCQ